MAEAFSMRGSSVATSGQFAMPVITEVDKTFGTIQHTLESFRLEDLRQSAEVVLTLSDVQPDRPISKYDEADLRALLLKCAEKLYHSDPDMLSVIENFVDAIARARLKVVLSQRRPNGRAAGD
jgi:hypothetical protein